MPGLVIVLVLWLVRLRQVRLRAVRPQVLVLPQQEQVLQRVAV
jgi:hypothetical protein